MLFAFPDVIVRALILMQASPHSHLEGSGEHTEGQIDTMGPILIEHFAAIKRLHVFAAERMRIIGGVSRLMINRAILC